MPILQLYVNQFIPHNTRKMLLSAFPEIISHVMKKPLNDVMVIINRCDITMGVGDTPAALLDLSCINGLTIEVKKTLCNEFGQLLRSTLSVELSRIYFNFNTVMGSNAWRFADGNPVCPETASGG